MIIDIQYSIVFNPFWGCLIPGRKWFASSIEERRIVKWSGSGDDPVEAVGMWIVELGNEAAWTGRVTEEAKNLLLALEIDGADKMREICILRPNLGEEVLRRAKELRIEINIQPPYGEPERLADEQYKKLKYRIKLA